MKSREISRSKTGPFSLACTDPYIGIGWEYQSKQTASQNLTILEDKTHNQDLNKIAQRTIEMVSLPWQLYLLVE